MKTKTQSSLSLKLLVISVFIAFLLLFVLRSRLTSSGENTSLLLSASSISHAFLPTSCSSTKCNNKIPSSVAKSLIHYATSNTTPQQKLDEISITSNILDKKSPCNFLVFGLGHDSLMWHTLNFGGRTIFLDEDVIWIEKIKKKFPMLESYHVTYDSKVKEANVLMEAGKKPDCTAIADPRYSKCQLALKGLPNEIYDIKWDLIMVDAPTGFHENAPGRMTAIYTAGMMARNKENGETHVFVHDVHRNIEDKFSKAFLCDGYMKKQVGKLRHFTIPSHKNNLDMPFCP
ncbi:glucuronoxylan 4-O-methyltransferase 1-like [Nicotiana tabacum]|uniref:Glucuronoxylan 4-O-methyltransferase 1-like n=1 Tax=Nicotiana tabacum TaxID=4097 RepID=A0A1S3Y1H1_TOBAC|nr:glucuronoxylan 4-O-methyltransferase 1-like [Nicotiana tomentosiformis]XP_016446073.1 PREDICTED: glucuronoxylan 4-O-methyltransferase 1-like [Nicotiana tabacum]